MQFLRRKHVVGISMIKAEVHFQKKQNKKYLCSCALCRNWVQEFPRNKIRLWKPGKDASKQIEITTTTTTDAIQRNTHLRWTYYYLVDIDHWSKYRVLPGLHILCPDYLYKTLYLSLNQRKNYYYKMSYIGLPWKLHCKNDHWK